MGAHFNTVCTLKNLGNMDTAMDTQEEGGSRAQANEKSSFPGRYGEAITVDVRDSDLSGPRMLLVVLCTLQP